MKQPTYTRGPYNTPKQPKRNLQFYVNPEDFERIRDVVAPIVKALKKPTPGLITALKQVLETF